MKKTLLISIFLLSCILGFAQTTVSTPQQLLSALSSASAGDIIYITNGTYTFTSRFSITKNGTSGNLISLLPHPDNTSRALLDFSSMSESSSNRAITLSGNYWHIKGIDVFGAGDNGMFINGSNNLIEFCTFSECKDSGLQIGNGGANNTIVNCDSFNNADASLENADGFAAKLDVGTGNKFIGCRAWQNLDDGWDGYLRGADNVTTTYENCWAIRNGYLKSGAVGAGDGNGFKTGGSDDKLLKHNAIYYNCIAAGNVYDGFDHNSNRGVIEIYNSSAYSNGRNISFGSSNIANSLTIKNSVSVSSGSNDSFNAINKDITNNSWQNGLVANAADFESLDIFELMTANRAADGSLPNVDFMALVAGSDLIDAGVDVGLPFNGSAPDLGYLETGTLGVEDFLVEDGLSNYPNPFSTQTNVVFNLKQATKIKVGVYNLLGVEVLSLKEKAFSAGNNSFILNRNHLSSGNYMLILKDRNNQKYSRLIAIK
ncbi:right-handed parallel beta-helix repeat-containing protein [Flavisericum labens]|uniref:right-handed parallel beta-helix repeat-containing protein n=1 Tax=Flavisericum labens TaxID=3377112 RepID=UPI00387ABA10